MTKPAQNNRNVDVSFDPDRAARRLAGALEAAGDDEKKIRRAHRRASADVLAPLDAAHKLGAQTPDAAQLFKASWRLELADVPEGDAFKEATPAYVVRLDGNAPLERLRRAGVLDAGQVTAGARFVALWVAAVKTPRVTASYDGVIAQGGRAPAPWVDVNTDAWKRLRAALGALLPVEFEIVRDVAVFETPIEALAKRGVVRVRKVVKAEGAVMQALSGGLSRLAQFWGLDAGAPHNADN